MKKPISRRDFAKGVLGASVAACFTPRAFAGPQTDAQETQLSQPLPEDVQRLFQSARKNIGQLTQNRLKHKLAENSEPCTRYVCTIHKRGELR